MRNCGGTNEREAAKGTTAGVTTVGKTPDAVVGGPTGRKPPAKIVAEVTPDEKTHSEVDGGDEKRP